MGGRYLANLRDADLVSELGHKGPEKSGSGFRASASKSPKLYKRYMSEKLLGLRRLRP